MTEPKAEILASTGACVQTMATGHPVYTGPYSLWVWQYGVFIVDSYGGGSWRINGVAKNHPPGCPPVVEFVGDCWQSVSNLAATKDTPKWIVATGSPEMCASPAGESVMGLQVWKFQASPGPKWTFYGLIRSTKARSVGGDPRISGDYAWSKCIPGGPEKWIKYDIPGKVVIDDNVNPDDVPAADIQSDVAGFTYTIKPVHPDPIPPQYPGPSQFKLTRSGGTPVPELPLYCPKDPVNREQLAAFLNSTINWMVDHPGQKLPAATEAVFRDVGLDYPTFGQVINQIGKAGISAGKGSCEKS